MARPASGTPGQLLDGARQAAVGHADPGGDRDDAGESVRSLTYKPAEGLQSSSSASEQPHR